jgi:hypothetical protein
MSNESNFLFHIPFVCGEVDEQQGIIRGVSLITGNLTAEGHDLEVDEATLKQALSCARKMGKVPVKLNHGSGVERGGTESKDFAEARICCAPRRATSW